MNVHRLLLFLTLGLALVLPIACRRTAPALDEEADEPSPTPELAPATAIALATATATAAATATATATAAAAPTATLAPTATSLPAPTASAPAPTPATAAPTASPTSLPPPTATPCGPPDGWVAYTVQAGDTLAGLARATATTVAEIQLANCLTDSLIFAGSPLYLPSLPATATPSPPPLLVLDGSQPLGTAPVTGTLTYDDAFLVRIDVRRSGAGDQNGAGIARVEFIVSHEGAELYRHTDDSPAYCLFGGGEPACTPWPLVDGLYRWGSSGPPVEPGHYLVRAWLYFTPESDDGSGITHDFWDFSFNLATPTAP